MGGGGGQDPWPPWIRHWVASLWSLKPKYSSISFWGNEKSQFFLEINLLIKKLTSENDDNSRLEKIRFQSAGRAKMCTFVAIGGGGGLNNQV